MQNDPSISKILRVADLTGYLGLSRATIHRLRAAGGFPRPIQLSLRTVGFRQNEIDEWLSSRKVLTHFCEAFA